MYEKKKKTEYSYDSHKRMINKYCRENEYKLVITQYELVEEFNEKFNEDFDLCLGNYGGIVETMDEVMDKNGYDFFINCLKYIKRKPYKKRPRVLEGQQKFKV